MAAAYTGRVIHSRTLAATLARLALVAVLLLALAPSLSRVLAAGNSPVLAGGSELCTATGLKWLAIAAQSPAAPLGAPVPAMPGGDAHCDYCPLAASMPLLALFVAFLLPLPPRGPAPAWIAPRLRRPANLRGLGSRGPPLPL